MGSGSSSLWIHERNFGSLRKIFNHHLTFRHVLDGDDARLKSFARTCEHDGFARANKKRLARKIENALQLRALNNYLSGLAGTKSRIGLIELESSVKSARGIAAEFASGCEASNRFYFGGKIFIRNRINLNGRRRRRMLISAREVSGTREKTSIWETSMMVATALPG